MNTNLESAKKFDEKYPGFICNGKCDTCLFCSWRKLFDSSNVFNLTECNSFAIKHFNLSILNIEEFRRKSLQIKAFEDDPGIYGDRFICQYNGNSDECYYCDVCEYAKCIGYKMIGESEDHWRLFQSPDGDQYSCKTLLKDLCGVSIVENNAYIKYASILFDTSKLKPFKKRLKAEIIAQIKGTPTVIVDDKAIPREVTWYSNRILNEVSKETKSKINDHTISIADAASILIDEKRKYKEQQEEEARKHKEKELQDKLNYFRKFLYDQKHDEVYDTIFNAPICCNNCRLCRIYRNVYNSHGIECHTKNELRSKCCEYAKLYEDEIIDVFKYFRISEIIESKNHGGITSTTTWHDLANIAKKYLDDQRFLKDKKARLNKQMKENT